MVTAKASPISQLTPEQLDAWSELQRADGTVDSPFFRPEFTQLVGRVRDNVEVGVLEEDGRCVGFFPFERVRRRIGRPIAGALSDMQGVVAQKGVEWDASALLRGCGLTAWPFDHLLATQKPFFRFHESVEDSPYIDLRQGYEAYKKAKRQAGSSALSQAERKTRKLGREIGTVRLEWHTGGSAVFAALCSWKREQLQRLHFADMFRCPHVVDLLDLTRSATSEAFSGVMTALYAGDRLLAVQLSLRSFHVLSSWIPTYDAELARYSPGLILQVEQAKLAPGLGVTRIDLGRGENQLKLSLMSGAVPVALGAVDHRTVRRMLRKSWYRARDLVYATPLRGAPLELYRRVRNRITPRRSIEQF